MELKRAITEHLVEVLAEVVRASADAKNPAESGTEVSKILSREGVQSNSCKKLRAKPQPAGLAQLEEALHDKIPERHLLDVVVRIARLTGFGRHLGPLSGNEPKQDDAWERRNESTCVTIAEQKMPIVSGNLWVSFFGVRRELSMQIQAIHVYHFLSFDTFVWEDLDPHLNVIVGPNGVGKTNLFRALQAVRDALSSERDEATTRWSNAGHQEATEAITIILDLQFTTEWEQRLLCTFLGAVLCNEQAIYNAMNNNATPQSLKRFSAWVQEHLRPEDLSWLFSGRLTATLAGRIGWQCQYEAQPGKLGFRLDLNGMLFGLAPHSNQAGSPNWVHSLPRGETNSRHKNARN